MPSWPASQPPAPGLRRVLVLSPCDVFPPVHGSSMAIYHTLQYLSATNRVWALLCALYSQHGAVDLGSPHLTVRYSRESPLDRLGYKGLLVNPHYYQAAWQAARAFRPDVIQAELLWTAPAALWLRRLTGAPVVLMQENVEYHKFVRFGLTSPFLQVIKWLEGWACRSADRVLALSEVDRDLMRELYGVPPDRFRLVPHGVDPELFAYRPQGAAAARQQLGVAPDVPVLTFVGKLDYFPNVRAVEYIAEQIAPAVWQQHPTARFVIIGQGADSLIRYQSERIVFTGFVDARPGARPNLSDYLSASDAVLVPLDAGSGTRLKILEAAANARPIVSTCIGAEGQSFEDGQEILLTAAVDGAFVTATLRLLQDPDLRQRLGLAARNRVLAQYTWQAQVRQMEQVYEELRV